MRKGLTYYEVIFATVILSFIILPTLNGFYVSRLAFNKSSSNYMHLNVLNNSLASIKDTVNNYEDLFNYNTIDSLPFSNEIDLESYNVVFSIFNFDNELKHSFTTKDGLISNINITGKINAENDYIVMIDLFNNQDVLIGNVINIISFDGGSNE